MSEDQIPEWDRARREILSQLRGVWDEISNVTDWSWRNEQRLDDIDKRLLFIEKQYLNLRRDFDKSNVKPTRTNAKWERF